MAVFSSNYTLYGDLSARVMKTLTTFTPSLEVYSIDEAFLDLTGMPYDVVAYSQHIRKTVRRWTGIPIAIGLGPTKTLAKVANKLSKKNSDLDGVLDFGASPDPDGLLEQMPVGDVWGIGRRYAAMLERYGVVNARQFRDLPRDFVKRKMTVAGLHALLELQGIPCIDLGAIPKECEPLSIASQSSEYHSFMLTVTASHAIFSNIVTASHFFASNAEA